MSLYGVSAVYKQGKRFFSVGFDFLEYNQIESLHWDNRNPDAGFFDAYRH